MNKLKIVFILIIGFLFLTACENNKEGYPIFLAEGKKVDSEYTTFGIQPRKFIDREMLSIGVDLEGNSICLGRNGEYRICSQEIKDKDPGDLRDKEPKKPEYPDDWTKISEKERKEYEAKRDAYGEEIMRRYLEPYYQILDKLPKPDRNFVIKAIDINGNEIPFVMAGNGEGYCRKENDNICYQYTLDEENSKIKSLEGVEIKAIKIKTVENTLTISNIYVVGPYRRSIF